jgi:hypothetical protein
MTENHQAKGGRARAASMTAEERSLAAQKAAQARWAADLPRSTHEGPVHIGPVELQAAVLPDGTRVLSQRTFLRAIGRSHSIKGGAGGAANGDQLPFFLRADRLAPYVSEELRDLAAPVQYTTKSGKQAFGYDATLLPMVCEVYLRYRDDLGGQVPSQYQRIVGACDILMRGLAHVGIIALIDESTGYQEVRDRLALQAILDKFLKKELAAWMKRFPDEFYYQIFRLRGWEMNEDMAKRPQVVASYTNNIVYQRLAPGILEELEARNPKNDQGRRRGKHHQWLTDDVGHPALAQHLHAVIALMRASSSWNHFMTMLNISFPKRGDTLTFPVMAEFDSMN